MKMENSKCRVPSIPFKLTALAAMLSAMTAASAYAAPADNSGDTAVVAGSDDSATKPAASPSDMQVVEVTASKRRERLMDAPMAITAISSAAIEKLGVNSFNDYASLVPNLNQVEGQGAGQGAIVIRGMRTGPQQLTNATAFYLGETPFSASGAMSYGSYITPDPDLAEVARVEVLKGPQGTLYGASSLGGLIRVVPKEPDTDELYGSVKLGVSSVADGGKGYAGKMSLNIPIAKDLFGLQVNAFRRRDAGFTTNVTTGHHDLGTTNASGGSVTALLTPTKDLRLTLRAMSQKLESNGPTFQENVMGTGTPVTGERQFAAFYDLPISNKYDLVEFNTQYQVGLGTLTGTLSHAKYKLASNLDYTNAYAQLFSPTGLFCTARKQCAPADYHGATGFTPGMSKDTAELRFASRRLGAFEFLAGGFYTDEANHYYIHVSGQNSAGVVFPAPFDNIATNDTQSTYKESAAFGNLTWYLADSFDLSSGIRYAKNKQSATVDRSGMLSAAVHYGVASEDDSTTWQATARWRPSKTLSTYAKVSTGYRPGGPQTNPNPPAGAQKFYDPDTVTNYEAGIKGRAADGRLTYDVSVYHIDWKKVQLNSLFNGVVLTGNAGKAVVDGVEAQAAYSDPSGLSVGASFGYNNARLKELGSATAEALGAAVGDQLPGTPKLTAAIYGDYRFPAFESAQASVGATLRHQGEKPSSYPNDPLSPNYIVPAYSTLDLRAMLEWGRYSLRFAVDNATDKNGVTGLNTVRVLGTQSVVSQAFLIRPRTVSLTAGMTF